VWASDLATHARVPDGFVADNEDIIDRLSERVLGRLGLPAMP